MLILKHKVPPALILPDAITNLGQHLANSGAHWFCALPEHLGFDDEAPDVVTELKSRTSTAIARTTRTNSGHSRLSETGGLVFRDGAYCGFMLENLSPDPTRWSCALRLRSPVGDARTLFTLKPENTDNYLFLHQADGGIQFKDQQTTLDVTHAGATDDDPLLVLAGASEDRLWLKIGDAGRLQAGPAAIPMDGPFTLFIGCRTNKARLKKTLGRFDLLDLVFWPDRNVLEPGHAETLDALSDPALWRPAP